MIPFNKNIKIIVNKDQIIANGNNYNYTELTSGVTSKVYLTKDNKYIFKKIIKYITHDVFEREVYIIDLLNKNNFLWAPELINFDDENKIIMMTYCGKIMNNNNKPDDYLDQFEKILTDMESINLQHNDIKKGKEILVKDNKIYICDFGWASINNELGCNAGYWNEEKPAGVIDDKKILEYYIMYKDKKRDTISNGSQKEVPEFKLVKNDIHISGYQKYTISGYNINFLTKKGKYNKILTILKDFKKKDCKSILDIGTSNGLVPLLANFNGYISCGLDHDMECIHLINKIIKTKKLLKISCKSYNWGDKIKDKYDIVSMFALIHWIYSCTSINGNFDKIFSYISDYIGKYLLIEWVSPEDGCIRSFNHTSFNKTHHTEEYNVENFERSLKKNIGKIISKEPLEGKTRILYIVKKK